MFLREIGRAAAWLLMVFALLAALTIAATRAVYAAPEPADPAAIQAEELQGFLPNQGDTHYLGLESAGAAKMIVLTLKSWTPEGLPVAERLQFAVLTEEGLHAVLTGAAPQEAAVAAGKLLRVTEDGVIAQAIVPAGNTAGYTVVVWNESTAPVSYSLTARNGVLIDGSGQTVQEPAPAHPADAYPLISAFAQTATLTEERVIQAAPHILDGTPFTVSTDTVTAYRISGSLFQLYDRHFLDLIPAKADAEITVRLTYNSGFQQETYGKVNFWVLTKSGLQQVIQGAFPKELNLAAGQPVEDGRPGEMQATLRIGGEGPYTLIVFNDSTAPVAYTLTVEGALLADTFGQTNEAKAAVAEMAITQHASEEMAFFAGQAATFFRHR
jgi:hypothetical protein